jgi:hypothetical protein
MDTSNFKLGGRQMNRLTKIILLGLWVSLFLCTSAMAATYSFNDNYNEWPGFSTALSGQDTYGNPHLESVDVSTDASGNLQNIRVNFSAHYDASDPSNPDTNYGGVGLSNSGNFNSLFIKTGLSAGDDITQGSFWDFYLFGQIDNDYDPSGSNSYRASLYARNSDTWNYNLANAPDYRNNHPNGIDGKTQIDPSSLFSGFTVDQGGLDTGGSITYDFSGQNIHLGSSFAIGYSEYCANDVFYTAVPEPSTLFLLCAGLPLGICVFRRKK